MKKVIALPFLLFAFFANAQHATPQEKLKEVFDPKNKMVLVCAHRGDWRNTPENSLQGLKNCIAMGIDMVELDLKKTKDGVLIIMHDKTIDRTTTGTGRPQDYTLDSLKKLFLRKGNGAISTIRYRPLRSFYQ